MANTTPLAEFFAIAVMAAVAVALIFASFPNRETWAKTGWGAVLAMEAARRGALLEYPDILANLIIPPDTVRFLVACGFFIAAAAGHKRRANTWIASALAISAAGAISCAVRPELAVMFTPVALILAGLVTWRRHWSAMTVAAAAMVIWGSFPLIQMLGFQDAIASDEMALATGFLAIVSGLAIFTDLVIPGRYSRERSGGIRRKPRSRPEPIFRPAPSLGNVMRDDDADWDGAEIDEPDRSVELNQLLTTILASMTEGLVVLDADGNVVVMNDTLRRFLDLPDRPDARNGGPLAFRPLLDQVAERGDLGVGDPRQAAAAFHAHLQHVAEHREPAFEWDLPDGRTCLVSSDSLPDGGLLATFTEITEQRNTLRVMSQARDAAERGNRAKTEFLTRMSHELRTPLNSIIGFAGMLRDETLGPIGVEEYRGFANDIGASGQVLLARINAVLDVARLEAGTLKLTEAIIDPRTVLDAAIHDAQPIAAANGIGFHAYLSPDLPALRADEARLRQIIDHLLDNARKFSQTGGEIAVRALADPFEGIAIHVSDQGIGMTDEEVNNAFEPFAQAETALDRQYEGTGLGLSLVKGLVDLHGGRITIASVPGRGTTVSVTLPPERMVLDL